MRMDTAKEFLLAQYRIITRHRWGTFGAMIIVFFALVGLLAPWLAPHEMWDTLRDESGKMAILRPPSWEFPLGTTALGRDILSQMIYATRTTVLIGLASGLISIVIGANLGLISGYFGGRVDEIIMRFTDIIVFFALVGLLAPWLAPHAMWDTLRDASGKMAILRPPSWEFPLGTTALGRDILSQMIYATRTTVLIGLASGLISIIIGANLGLISGYFGGRVDEIVMRFTDVIYGMPFLPFLIVLISLFGRSIWFVIIAICCIVWRTSARVIRAQTLAIKQRQFILAAKARGCSDFRIIYGQIMPNIMPLLLLYTAFNIAWSVLAEAGASFLGFSDPNNLSWGGMLYNLWISGKIRSAWWWFAAPSVCVVLLVSALVFVSRAYEEVANPRLQER